MILEILVLVSVYIMGLITGMAIVATEKIKRL